MSCNITVDNHIVLQKIKEMVGTNDTLCAAYVTAISTANGFKSDFAATLKNRMEIDVNNPKESDIPYILDYVKEYYNKKHPKVEASTTIKRESTNVTIYGYSSVEARELGKRISANFALQGYIDVSLKAKTSVDNYLKQTNDKLKKAGKKPISKRQLFESIIQKKIVNEITNRLVNSGRATKEEINNLIKNNDTLGLEKLFGENVTIQDNNLLAIYKEIKANSKVYFDEVFRDNRLGNIRIQDEHGIEEDSIYDAIDEQLDELETEEEITSEHQKDGSISQLNNKMGEYSSFAKHVDMTIRTYFNSLSKLHSPNKNTGIPDLNKDNDLGIADTMDAAQCVAVLYSYGNFNSVGHMITSVRQIAENVPGMQAFYEFANKLEQDKDFAFEVYCSFGKTVISKIETVVKDESVSSRRSNRTADKLTALKFEYINSSKSTTIINDEDYQKQEAKILNDLIADIKTIQNQIQKDIKVDINQEKLNNLKKQFTSIISKRLKVYYPTIQDAAISNYLTNNNSGNFNKNAETLITILNATINAGDKTKQNYTNKQLEISKAWKHNVILDERRREGERISSSENIDMEPLYAISYFDKSSEAAAIRLAEELVRYSVVKTDLNSRNVNGNQSSDVINNSMITNLIKTLQSTIATENYSKYKFQSRQYDFSNILVEHRDKNGAIINRGLFRKTENGEYIPTDYAHNLISVSLFNGANNQDRNDAALYSEMSQGDYIATAIVNFFNVEDDFNSETKEQIDKGNYFMRIPSDAPKNFVVTAPIYKVGETRRGANDGLFIVDNINDVNKLVRNKFNELVITDTEQYETLTPKKSNLNDLVNRATSKIQQRLNIRKISELNEDKPKIGDNVSITYEYEKDGVSTQYVMRGTLEKVNDKLVVNNAEFVGFLGYERSTDVNNELNKTFISQLINSGEIKRKVNTNHPIYQQFRQIFIQELTDASNALSKIFEFNSTKDGLVKHDKNTGMPIFKAGFDNSPQSARRTYTGYHHAKGKGFYDVVDGRAVLNGKVFTSDKFTIGTRNYGQELLDKSFSFLYGGASNTYVHRVNQNVELTEAQEQAVEDMLNEFISDYIYDAQERIEKHRSFIPAKYLEEDKIAEFALNHHLMYVAFNDLFEGDTKFYKSFQDFLKRAKEAQGSGVPYGIVNYETSLVGNSQHIDSSLDTTEFEIKDSKGNVVGTKKFELKDRFTGVTITNTVRTSAETQVENKEKGIKDGSATQLLINALKASGMKVDEAKEKARSMMSDYAQTTVDDAQSYITFDEWVRRITARGQFNKYKPLIEAILDESKPIPVNLINEFVQVQKNFYYDQHYNAELGVIAPRQIKNAEFVLVPRFVKGTQLEEIARIMEEHNIDQLNTEETSKAGKCNVLTIFDKSGNITEETLEDFANNVEGAKEQYNYNYLYTQQETPQHINAENKAGIQIMKKILDNISPDNKKLYPIKEKFFRLYCANIKSSFKNLINELKLELDENGNLKLDKNGDIKGLDYEIFFDRLQEEVARLGLDSNMMDYVTLVEDAMFETSDDNTVALTKMPTYMSNVMTKLENISQSIFNSRITRQTLPGFHAAQITPVGFTKKDGQIRKDSALRYHPDDAYQHKESNRWISKNQYDRLSKEEQDNYKKGIAPYVEVMLPANNFGLNWDGSEEQQKELIAQLEDAGLDQMIGYRIPTEGKQSVCIMKVVGFTHDAQGSTIVVPDNWVSQTGSDFDIDSVYGINFTSKFNKQTKRQEKVKYNDSISEEENSKDARNNELLQCMIDILSDLSSVEENFSRSNFEDIINARDGKPDPKTGKRENGIVNSKIKKQRAARSSYNIFDQAEMQEDAMSGAKLKAFSVTRDTFCSVCNTVRPTISKDHRIKIVYTAKDGYTYKDLVNSFGKDNVESKNDGKHFIVTHDKIGWTHNNKNVEGKILTAYSSQTTAHILDAIKEGAIPNVNDFTFQVYKLFPDLGSNYETAIAFIMQPGVTEIVNAYNSTKSIYSDERAKPIEIAIRNIATKLIGKAAENMSIENILNTIDKKYKLQFMNLFGVTDKDFNISTYLHDINKMLISYSHLKFRIDNNGKTFNDSREGELNKTLFDLGVVLQYHKLNQLGNSISDYARVCNPDKFGAKQSIFETRQVFEDILKLDSNSKQPVLFATVNDKTVSFIEAIYPDVKRGLDFYITSDNNNSLYPPLNNFLKYATATSIKVARHLFETQNPEFVKEIYKLANLFSGENKLITKQIYRDFEHYVLGHLYGRTSAVQQKVYYFPEEGWRFEAGANIEEERRRIFGYDKEPNTKVPDGHGEFEIFEPNDVTKPTRREIIQFASLSPAQKVQWIQEHFDDAGVFKYIDVSLFNSTQYRKSKAGMQTIEFKEDNINIETVYDEFEKAFFNSNPLVAMTAMDVVKYGFVVEGFRMRKNAVNKMIKNSVLMQNEDTNGTNIVYELNKFIGNITDGVINMDRLRHDFIRSHSDIHQIETHYVKKVDKETVVERFTETGETIKRNVKTKDYELSRTSDGIIVLDIDETLATKYGFSYNIDPKHKENPQSYVSNDYVKLRFGKDTILYKIQEDTKNFKIIAYPVNLLESTESNVELSSNSNNNKHLPEDYYLEIINDWYKAQQDYYETIEEQTEETIQNAPTIEQSIKKLQGTKEKYKVKPKSKKLYAESFDINKTEGNDVGAFEQARSQIIEFFTENPVGQLYILNGGLAKYIKHTGEQNGSIQTINGKQYNIVKVNIGKRMKSSTNPTLDAILKKAEANGYKPKDVFLVTPHKEQTLPQDDILFSNITEANAVNLGINSMKAMKRREMSEGDVDAGNVLRRLNDKDIMPVDPSVSANVEEVTRVSAQYVQNTVDKLINDLQYFIQDSDGIWYSVNSSETIDLIRNNPAERKRFLKTILDARAFVSDYGMINHIDIDSEDNNIKNNLRKIKESINKLENATIINKAEERFANDYLAKLSNNPLIQNDILSLLDGYHSAAAFDAWVNDLQETSSPLLQIITKEVMADIRAKEMIASKEFKEVKKRLDDIKERARKAGLSINYDNIIDEDGKFIQQYNNAFVEKISELRQNIVDTRVEYGNNSLEHLQAKLEYDKFKLAHTNQKLNDDYYRKKIELEDMMLNGIVDPITGEKKGPFTKVYVAYQQAIAKRREIQNYSRNGVLADEYKDQLKEINKEIDKLTQTYIYDETTGNFIDKMDVNDPNNPLQGDVRIIYSINSANALENYRSSIAQLREEYFEDDAVFGFYEELDKNLDIVANYEERDRNGRPTVPISELMKHEDYVNAKEWLEHNARFVVPEDIKELINSAFKNLREGSKGRKVLSHIAKNKELYDSHGVIDGTKLTEEEILKIRAEQLANYNINENQPFSDRTLISNAPTDDTVFESSFYKGMTTNSAKNPEYLAKVNEINELLNPYFYTDTRTLHTSQMSIEELEQLDKLYNELEEIKSTNDVEARKKVRKYITDNVEFVYDMAKYEDEKRLASQKGNAYLRIWQKVNERIEEIDGSDKVVPNRYIYGYAVPKGYKQDGSGNNDLVNKKKTEALRTIRNYCITTTTEYYYRKRREMLAKSTEEFKNWYDANHIYNPHTHTVEPLQCWTTMRVNPMVDDGQWVPAYNQTERNPKEDMLNPNFKVGSTASNFKGNSSDEYYNNSTMNEYEKEVKALFEETLYKYAKTTQAKRYLDGGYMVSRSKGQEHDAKFYAKESIKLLGWIDTHSGRDAWYDDIDYANDRTIAMPMTSLLKSKDSIKVNKVAPNRKDFSNDKEYEDAVEKYNKEKKEIEEQNAKIHRDLLDRNWENVLEDYVIKAAHFNAVQDNKYMLFYAKRMIDKIDVYVKNEGFNDLQKDYANSDEYTTNYVTKKDTRLQEQYANWIRRLVYDQWKKPNGNFTRAANILQSLTSAKFMMLNITGGIANITLGTTQILGEVFAKNYFGTATWAKGLGLWHQSIGSFMADMYKSEASSLPSAIVKFFNIVDFTEHSGSVNIPDASTYIERVRDLMFSPQAIGEHGMQNGVLFSMLMSHRLVLDPNAKENGRLNYKVVNEAEFIRDANEQALSEIMTDEQKVKFEQFKKEETSDPNVTKSYAWFRKDLTTEFANIYLTKEQQKEFVSKRKDIQDKKKEEFNNDEKYPTLYSQLKLDEDGTLGFKDDSILSSIGEEAYQILGTFKGRVISVNKEIHGIYDKLGAAKWESYWWGGLVMQYHKHIYPGIMKRWRRQGYFNEERGTIEKGCYWSIKDFLSIPLHKTSYTKRLQAENGMTDSELQTAQGIQNIVRNYVEFATHIKLHWNMLPENERANVRKALGDMVGVLSAVCVAIGLHAFGDDDEDNLIYNLAMYEADRLASESFMYNPLGLISEGKKLWSSPIAATNGIEDAFSAVGFIAQYMIAGDDFDPYYKSGLYAGEHKGWVMLKRNIPMYRPYSVLTRLDRNNKYYKLGDNMLSIIPVKDIAEWINE